MTISKVTVYFPCPVEQMCQTVTDLTHTDWRSDLARVEVLDEAHFVEYTKSGYATSFAVTDCEPLRPWLSEAAAEVVSGRFAEEIAEMSRVNLRCLRQRAILPTMAVTPE